MVTLCDGLVVYQAERIRRNINTWIKPEPTYTCSIRKRTVKASLIFRKHKEAYKYGKLFKLLAAA
jgi:hypothetical protein